MGGAVVLSLLVAVGWRRCEGPDPREASLAGISKVPSGRMLKCCMVKCRSAESTADQLRDRRGEDPGVVAAEDLAGLLAGTGGVIGVWPPSSIFPDPSAYVV
jgi:hypothetical protein